MTAPDEGLVQQLAEQFAYRVASVSDWPGWMQVPALGHDITPVVERVLSAALASGLLIPAEPVRHIANHYDGKRVNGSQVANRLRAILGDEQHVRRQQ